MFDLARNLFTRDDTYTSDPYGPPSTAGGPPGAIPHAMVGLLIALLILLILSLLLISALLVMRHRRRARRNSLLPVYDEKRLSSMSSSSHRRIMVRPSESVYVYQEKQNLLDNSLSPPPSPIPEIRITFPEEIDDSGKRKSGRVVVVRVSDSGTVGLEPVEGGLPSYQEDGARFQSIDLERVGGLVEKARNAPAPQQQ